jgi:hypothetical protein
MSFVCFCCKLCKEKEFLPFRFCKLKKFEEKKTIYKLTGKQNNREKWTKRQKYFEINKRARDKTQTA